MKVIFGAPPPALAERGYGRRAGDQFRAFLAENAL
jgi:hypothetical protein